MCVCVCFVCACVWVCMCKCDLLQSRWEEDLSSHITSSGQKAFILAPRVTQCYRQVCVRAHTNSVKSVCVSLTVGVSVVTLGRGMSCVTNSNPDHSLWISYLLQSYKQRKSARKKTYLGYAPDFSFLGSRIPHLVLPPLKPRNKTPSDMHVSCSTNLHPLCPLIDWPQ